MDTVYEETYRGHEIKICLDEDYQSPEEWGDNNLFLVHYHNDLWITNDAVVTQDCLASIFAGFDDEDNEKEILEKYRVYLVSAYIHSGVSLRLGAEAFAGCLPQGHYEFDVSRCGAVLVSREEWPDEDKAEKAAQSLVNEWNEYLSGQVYGYMIDGPACDDSCWGFYGDYDKYCLPEARSIVDCAIKYAQKKHIERLKTWIKNNVPLYARQPMPT